MEFLKGPKPYEFKAKLMHASWCSVDNVTALYHSFLPYSLKELVQDTMSP